MLLKKLNAKSNQVIKIQGIVFLEHILICRKTLGEDFIAMFLSHRLKFRGTYQFAFLLGNTMENGLGTLLLGIYTQAQQYFFHQRLLILCVIDDEVFSVRTQDVDLAS